MRLHITLDDADVRRLDERVGARRRSRFISEAVRQALDESERWESLESAIGSIPDADHEWDDDPAAWVRRERRADRARVG